MGEPRLQREQIPMRGAPGEVINEPLLVNGATFDVTAVSMGNPHCVVFVDAVGSFDVAHWGPLFEHHDAFPERVNTEFIQVDDRESFSMRVWERGSGETLACGTGAAAAAWWRATSPGARAGGLPGTCWAVHWNWNGRPATTRS